IGAASVGCGARRTSNVPRARVGDTSCSCLKKIRTTHKLSVAPAPVTPSCPALVGSRDPPHRPTAPAPRQLEASPSGAALVPTRARATRPRSAAARAPVAPGALRCRRKFLRFFPGGFADETYIDWERDYKWAAHARWREQLGPDELGGLIAAGQ